MAKFFSLLLNLFESRRERMWREAPVCLLDEGCRITFHGEYPVQTTRIYEVRP